MWTMFLQSVPATRRRTHHVTNILPRLTPKKTRTREIIYCHISEIIITIVSLNHLIFFSTWCSCLCFPTSQKLLYGISTSYYDAEQGIVNQIKLNFLFQKKNNTTWHTGKRQIICCTCTTCVPVIRKKADHCRRKGKYVWHTCRLLVFVTLQFASLQTDLKHL